MQSLLQNQQRTWLVTGCAGFIGSHLTETLLKNGQRVRGVDNFATGKKENLKDIEARVGTAWKNFSFQEGDIANLQVCQTACRGVELVLHQAAMGSVPRSIKEPLLYLHSNLVGFVNMLIAARDEKVKRMVFASSSSVYGDHPDLPKKEEKIGKPLSPYALTKLADELWADVFFRNYGFESIGLRYFNVFGPRQDPNGAYAAVIPRWIQKMVKGEKPQIFGDGKTSRDFCFVENVVQVNLQAALTPNKDAVNQIFNVAVGDQTSLLELFEILKKSLSANFPKIMSMEPEFSSFREGDIRHSLASIDKAKKLLGYSPKFRVQEGLRLSLDWYLANL